MRILEVWDEYFFFEKFIIEISKRLSIDHYAISIQRLEEIVGGF